LRQSAVALQETATKFANAGQAIEHLQGQEQGELLRLATSPRSAGRGGPHMSVLIPRLPAVAAAHAGQPVLLPLTESLYISGAMESVEKVLIDIGTGYFVEVRPLAARLHRTCHPVLPRWQCAAQPSPACPEERAAGPTPDAHTSAHARSPDHRRSLQHDLDAGVDYCKRKVNLVREKVEQLYQASGPAAARHPRQDACRPRRPPAAAQPPTYRACITGPAALTCPPAGVMPAAADATAEGRPAAGVDDAGRESAGQRWRRLSRPPRLALRTCTFCAGSGRDVKCRVTGQRL
jgi:hypothetical protein